MILKKLTRKHASKEIIGIRIKEEILINLNCSMKLMKSFQILKKKISMTDLGWMESKVKAEELEAILLTSSPSFLVVKLKNPVGQ